MPDKDLDQLQTDNPLTAQSGDLIYGVRAGVDGALSAEDIALIGTATAAQGVTADSAVQPADVFGKATLFIPAGAMRPTVTAGATALADVETTAGRPDLTALNFATGADSYAQFQVAMPKNWDLGPVTFQVFWASTALDTDGVAWALQAVAVGDGDTIDVVFGTPVVVTDDAQSTTEDLYVTAESASLYIPGTTLGAELCTNTDFTDGSDFAINGDFIGGAVDWTLGTGWTVPVADAQCDGTQSGDTDLVNSGSIVVVIPGEVYTVTYTLSAHTAGNVVAVVGNQEGTDRNANNTYTELITASNGDDLTIRGDLNFIGTIDNVTIARVGDAGWTQGTGWLISTGIADSDASQAGDSDLTMAGILTSGQLYRVDFTAANRTAGNVTPVAGDTEGTDRAGNATYSEDILAAGVDLDIRADVTWDGDVDAISCKALEPADGDILFFQILRDVSDPIDDAAEDAQLIGIKLHYTTDALNDD